MQRKQNKGEQRICHPLLNVLLVITHHTIMFASKRAEALHLRFLYGNPEEGMTSLIACVEL